MSNIVAAVRNIILADSDVSALIGDRLQPQMIRQGTVLPAADIRLAAAKHHSHLWGRVGAVQGELIIDCYAYTPDAAHDLAQKMIDSGILTFKGSQSGVPIMGVEMGIGPNDFNDGPDPGTEKIRYGATISFRVVWGTTTD